MSVKGDGNTVKILTLTVAEMDERHLSIVKAKFRKNDEYYTLYEDIEKEIGRYLEWNPDLFKGRTILMPCDDPERSQFVRFFAEHPEIGYKKIIASCIAEITGIDSFSGEDAESRKGKILELANDNAKRNGAEALKHWHFLSGDGNFESQEVCRLKDEADFIVTNPPFSLFRRFADWVFESGNRFAVIGSAYAVNNQAVFRQIREGRMWLGASDWHGRMNFLLPDGSRTHIAAVWYTNIDHAKRHVQLELKTMRENLAETSDKAFRERGYRKYDNYDAVDVPRVSAIPSDYEGFMGVPVTFLSRYSPEQFEIVGFAVAGSASEGCPYYRKGFKDHGGNPMMNGKSLFPRILIRKRHSSGK